jgi:uncharacterized YigZ family protein
MRKIKDIIDNTIIIDKSKFITTLYPVETVDEINSILANVRKKYYDATHNCYAYIIDNGNIQKCSDDGEPSKTAGFPMLDALKKNNLTNVLAITTRYFGGIKLGAGGLIRAYSSSVSEALKNVTFYTSKLLSIYEVIIPYSDYSKNIDFWNSQMIKTSSFTSDVNLNIAFYETEANDFLDKIKNLTLGKALITFLQNEYIDVIDE